METSTGATQRHIQEDNNIHCHWRDNPKTNNLTITYLAL